MDGLKIGLKQKFQNCINSPPNTVLVAKKMLKTLTIDYLSTLTDISDIQEADFKNLMEAAKEQAKVMLEKFEVKCKKNKVGVEC